MKVLTPLSSQKCIEDEIFSSLKAFMSRYKHFQNAQQQTCSVVAEFLKRFRQNLHMLRKQEQDWDKISAPHFNIFRALRIERRETKLHSRFLAELLNPRGSHGQVDLFLRGFLDLLANHRDASHVCVPSQPMMPSCWQVRTEDRIQSGRLDIVLQYQCTEAPSFLALIENKVDAGEGPAQCDRYSRWLDEQKDYQQRQKIFLTPDGRKPSEEEAHRVKEWLCLSYEVDIVSWLEAALLKVGAQANHLRMAIDQYLGVVQNL